jgi:hypothetical protein
MNKKLLLQSGIHEGEIISTEVQKEKGLLLLVISFADGLIRLPYEVRLFPSRGSSGAKDRAILEELSAEIRGPWRDSSQLHGLKHLYRVGLAVGYIARQGIGVNSIIEPV